LHSSTRAADGCAARQVFCAELQWSLPVCCCAAVPAHQEMNMPSLSPTMTQVCTSAHHQPDDCMLSHNSAHVLVIVSCSSWLPAASADVRSSGEASAAATHSVQGNPDGRGSRSRDPGSTPGCTFSNVVQEPLQLSCRALGTIRKKYG
jgi:hypothetical protein